MSNVRRHEEIAFDMNQIGGPPLKNPTSADEVLQCLIWVGWDPSVAFDLGSKRCLNLKPNLIRESIEALRDRSDLSRYTYALTKIVDLTQADAELRTEWKSNLSQLRALMATSAIGTDRQRMRLLEIARNKRVVAAMRHALEQERDPNPKKVEPSWVAVLYADGTDASIAEADRFNMLLRPDTQAALLRYRHEAGNPDASRDA